MKKYIGIIAVILQITGVQIVQADAVSTPSSGSISFDVNLSAANHPAGVNVSSNGTVYFLDGVSLRPYTSAGAFISYGFNNWNDVQKATSVDLALPKGNFVPPMDGSLINDGGTIWIISKGQKLGFTNSASFTGLGYSYKNVIPGDASFLTTGGYITTSAQAHAVDTLISKSGTDYLVTSKGLVGIPSQSVFNSWGYSSTKVVPANIYDISSNTVTLPTPLAQRPTVQLSAGSYYISTILNQPLVPTVPTTTSNSTANTSLAQCGTNTSCMVTNAATCTLSEGILNPGTDFLGFVITDTDDYQIVGLQNNLCNVHTKVLAENVIYDPTGLAAAQASGKTAAQIQSDEQGATQSQAGTIGITTSCQFKTTDLVTYLNDIVAKNYTNSAVDFSIGNCSNTNTTASTSNN